MGSLVCHICRCFAIGALLANFMFSETRAASSKSAQDYTEQKIHLLGEALDARNRGDLLAAKRATEELVKLAGNDPNVQRLQSEINAQIATMKAATAQMSQETLSSNSVVRDPAAKMKNASDDSLVEAINRAAPPTSANGSAASAIDPKLTAKRVSFFSARVFVGDGDRSVSVNFTVEGQESRVVLIRGVGPGLKTTTIRKGFLKEPQIALVAEAGAKIVAANSDWKKSADSAFIEAMVAAGGGYHFDSAARDAAIVATLRPGSYSVNFDGVGGSTGIALLEIYQFTP